MSFQLEFSSLNPTFKLSFLVKPEVEEESTNQNRDERQNYPAKLSVLRLMRISREKIQDWARCIEEIS